MTSRDPKDWGPSVWLTMHMFSLNFPAMPTLDQQRGAEDFFRGMVYLIPCPPCAQHYKMALDKFPPPVHSGEALFEWTVMLHNKVNARLGKKVLTVEEAARVTIRNIDEQNNHMYLILGLIALILAVAVYLKKRKGVIDLK